MPCWRQKKKKKSPMLIISHQQRVTGRSYIPYCYLCFGWENLFSSPSGFTYLVSLIWKGIWLVQLL